MGEVSLARKIQVLAITLDLALVTLIVGWQLLSGLTLTRLIIAIVLILPLLAPLSGLWHGNRRTFAWTTLCVILYFVIGLTEAVAQPTSRMWSAPCLLLSLALFIVLIAYVRVTRPWNGTGSP